MFKARELRRMIDSAKKDKRIDRLEEALCDATNHCSEVDSAGEDLRRERDEQDKRIKELEHSNDKLTVHWEDALKREKQFKTERDGYKERIDEQSETLARQQVNLVEYRKGLAIIRDAAVRLLKEGAGGDPSDASMVDIDQLPDGGKTLGDLAIEQGVTPCEDVKDLRLSFDVGYRVHFVTHGDGEITSQHPSDRCWNVRFDCGVSDAIHEDNLSHLDDDEPARDEVEDAMEAAAAPPRPSEFTKGISVRHKETGVTGEIAETRADWQYLSVRWEGKQDAENVSSTDVEMLPS